GTGRPPEGAALGAGRDRRRSGPSPVARPVRSRLGRHVAQRRAHERAGRPRPPRGEGRRAAHGMALRGRRRPVVRAQVGHVLAAGPGSRLVPRLDAARARPTDPPMTDRARRPEPRRPGPHGKRLHGRDPRGQEPRGQEPHGPEARTPPTALPADIWVLVSAAFIVAIGYGIIAPILPQFAASFDLGVTAASIVVSSFAFFRLLFAPMGGRLVDKLGERRVYVVGLLIVAASTYAVAAATTYWQLLLFRGLGGIGSTMFTVSAMALIIRIAPPEARGKATGAYASS